MTNALAVYTVAAAVGLVVLGALIAITRFRAAALPYRTWLLMLPAVFVALWLGQLAWAVFVTVISIYGVKEFARATGLYRERLFMWIVYASIVAANLAAHLENYGHFMTVPLWAVAALTLVPIVRDRTEDMLQHFALAVVSVVYFGWFLAHLTYIAHAEGGLGPVVYVVLATQLNDVMAFLVGKRFGRHHWTTLSPNKTLEGSLFALAASVGIAFLNWPIAFPELPAWGVLLAGVIVGAGGQIGDLTTANFKRNIGIKDFGALLPGHGGILDRTNSLLFVAPVFMHLMAFFFGGYPL